MKEEDLEALGKGECYVLSPYEDKWDKREYLLRTGEIVKGIKASYKDTVVAWVNFDMDTYLGIGVNHGRGVSR